MILLLCATCCDSFFMSVAYGVERIQISWKATIIISLCGTFLLGTAILLAKVFTQFLSPSLGKWIGFLILICLGISHLFQAQVKRYVKKQKHQPLIIKLKGISFVVDIFLDETQADQDCSKELSMTEAVYLGIALSLDSLASGLAYGLGAVNVAMILLCSFLAGVASIICGSAVAAKLTHRCHGDVSWISGSLLILLALLRLR